MVEVEVGETRRNVFRTPLDTFADNVETMVRTLRGQVLP
jgi:hypothetical protein